MIHCLPVIVGEEHRSLEPLQGRSDRCEIIFEGRADFRHPAFLLLVSGIQACYRIVGIGTGSVSQRKTLICFLEYRDRVECPLDRIELILALHAQTRPVASRMRTADIYHEAQAIRKPGVNVCPEVIAFKRGILQNSILIHVPDTGEIAYLVRASGRGDIVLVGESEFVIDLVQPVGFSENTHFIEPGKNIFRPIWSRTVHLHSPVMPVDIILCIKHFRHNGVGIERDRAIV